MGRLGPGFLATNTPLSAPSNRDHWACVNGLSLVSSTLPSGHCTQPMDKGNRFSICRLRLQRSDRLRLRLSADPAAVGQEGRKKAGRAVKACKYVRAASGPESFLSRSSTLFL